MQTDYDDEVAFRRLPAAARPAAAAGTAAVLRSPSRSRTRTIPGRCAAATGISTTTSTSTLPAVAVDPARAGRPPQPAAARHVSAATARRSTADETRRPRHGYYAAHQLPRRAGRRAAGRCSTTPAWPSDTVVVFTSDHGEMLGERGPLVQDVVLRRLGAGAADRARPGRRAAAGVAGLRVAARPGADARGAGRRRRPATAGFAGSSLAGVLAGRGAGPDLAVGEYLAEGVRAPEVMIRRGRHKYLTLPGRPRPAVRPGRRPATSWTIWPSCRSRRAGGGFRAEVGTALGPANASSGTCSTASAGGGWWPRRWPAAPTTPWDFQPHHRRLGAVGPRRRRRQRAALAAAAAG